MTPELERELETHTVALNQWLYAEGIGLKVDEAGYAAPAEALRALYARLLDQADSATRYFAVENWSEAQRLRLDVEIESALDEHCLVPHLASAEGPLTWRNWKAFERETDDASTLADGFDELVRRSLAAGPLLAERLQLVRADFAAHGLTPAHTFCWREGTTPEALRAFLARVGRANRADFQLALGRLSQAVFGRPPGPAELRALYLNRMYEPTAAAFERHRPASAVADAVEATRGAFRRMGFDLADVSVDLENRPRKYPGAFCFPVATPSDVRVSVRIASAHHLVDMLYHEFGHAAHFAHIDADLPFVDRYWIHSGTHETFSTLFEYLLGEPDFLREQFELEGAAAGQLLDFHRFKQTLTNTWYVASALTSLDGWLESLEWESMERRYAAHVLEMTGVAVPPGFARLSPFVSAASVYPAGYVMAHSRVTRWLERLRALEGPAWWRSPAAQADVLRRIRAGGRARFEAAGGEAGG